MNANPMQPVKSSLPCASPRRNRFRPLVVAGLLACGLLPAARAADGVEPKPKPDPSRIIQYRGAMPMLKKSLWGGDVVIKFELYRSPNGGSPFWKETRTVAVRKDGWVSVDLGEVEPLPDEAFTTPFRFLSIWHEKIEFIPRKQVASLTYVAAPGEKDLPIESYKDYAASDLERIKAAAIKAPKRDAKLDTMVDCGEFQMEKNPRMPAPWLKAVETATRLGGRLPTFEEWYGAYDGKPSAELVSMAGHYEWVIPWVYEPSIHGRFQELYRGKTAACYYNELNPTNDYPFRLVALKPVKAKP